jgi:3-deoxy-7-phosphoheptulonate synthase
MIITLKKDIGDQDLSGIKDRLNDFGYKGSEVKTQDLRYLVAIGKTEIDIRAIGHLAGVKDVHRVSDAYKLVSRKWKVVPTVVDLGSGVTVEEGGFSIIAGPCSLESEDQIASIIRHLKEQDVKIMRGGAFKPRSSPYSFRGLGLDGLKLCSRLASEKGIRVVSEVLAASQIEDMYDYVDVYQVGTRNSQNFDLLHELGQVDKPVLLKRGMSGTLEELLQSAEYIFSNGNERLILCERGIRTFENVYRNTLDLNAVPVLKEKTHLPVIVDPSHGIGVRRWVEPMALAGIMAGADGIIVEVHQTPEQALSDGQQTLDFAESGQLIEKARRVFELRKGL